MIMQTVKTSTTSDTETSSTKLHPLSNRIVKWYAGLPVEAKLSDGMADVASPAFSRDGKYLFFAASTNFGLQSGWLDMTAFERLADQAKAALAA